MGIALAEVILNVDFCIQTKALIDTHAATVGWCRIGEMRGRDM
jgi:hypothetical protein